MRNPLDAAYPPLHRREVLDALHDRDVEDTYDEVFDHSGRPRKVAVRGHDAFAVRGRDLPFVQPNHARAERGNDIRSARADRVRSLRADPLRSARDGHVRSARTGQLRPARLHRLRSVLARTLSGLRGNHGQPVRRRSLLIRLSALIALATGTLLSTAAHAQVTNIDYPLETVRYMATATGDGAAAAAAPVVLGLLHERRTVDTDAAAKTNDAGAVHRVEAEGSRAAPFASVSRLRSEPGLPAWACAGPCAARQ